MSCPNCQHPIGEADKYCINCGADLSLIAAARARSAPAWPVSGQSTTDLGLAAVGGAGRLRFLGPVLVHLLLFCGSALAAYLVMSATSAREAPAAEDARWTEVAPQPDDPQAAPEPDEPAKPGRTTRARSKPTRRPGSAKPAPAASPGDPRPDPGKQPAPAAGEPPPDPGKPPPDPGKQPPSSGEQPGSGSGSAPAAPAAGEGKMSAPEQAQASLNADNVRFVISHYLSHVRACSDRAAKRQRIQGKVEIQFTVAADGSVSEAAVFSNTTGHQNLGQCIAQAFRRWRFPRPAGGAMTFIYPFIIAAGE